MAKCAKFVRGGAVAVASLVLPALLAGCGSSPTTPLAVVQAAAAETAGADTARVTMTMEPDGLLTGDSAIKAEGAMDFAANRGRISMDLGTISGGLIPGEVEYLFDGTAVYFRLPTALTGALPASKPWLRLDFDDVGDELGFDLEGIEQFRSNDPTAMLHYLRGSGEVTEVGNEEIRGVVTTRYQATLDLTKARDQVPEGARGAYDQARAQLGVDTLPAEIWVDDEGRMRKLALTVDYSKAENPDGSPRDLGKLRMTMTMELYDFGADVDVSPPPADQVGDLKTLIEEQVGGS
jgi:hypothetical protein